MNLKSLTSATLLASLAIGCSSPVFAQGTDKSQESKTEYKLVVGKKVGSATNKQLGTLTPSKAPVLSKSVSQP